MLVNRPAVDISRPHLNQKIVAEEIQIPRIQGKTHAEKTTVQIEIKTAVLLSLLADQSVCGEDMCGINAQDKQTLRSLYLQCLRCNRR